MVAFCFIVFLLFLFVLCIQAILGWRCKFIDCNVWCSDRLVTVNELHLSARMSFVPGGGRRG